jgi:hypothetical protein
MAHLTLRLLPTAESTQDEVNAMLSKDCSEPAKRAAGCFLCTKIQEPGVERGSVRCLGAPYRQHWRRNLIDEMSRIINTKQRSCEAKAFHVQIEVYHFTHRPDEKDLLQEIAETGARKLQRILALQRSEGAVLLHCIWNGERCDEDVQICGQVKLCRIGEASLLPHIKTLVNDALDAAARHLQNASLPQANGKCHTVILADTASAARKQAQWARGQRILVEQDGKIMESPLLGQQEEVLLLPLIDKAPDLQELQTNISDESQYVAWDPWSEYVDAWAEKTVVIAKCQGLHIKVQNAVFALPWKRKQAREDKVDHAIYELRRAGASRSESARVLEQQWDDATDLQRLQLLRLVVCGKGLPVKLEELKLDERYAGEKAGELAALWRDFPKADWSTHAALKSIARKDKAVQESKKALCARVQVTLGPTGKGQRARGVAPSRLGKTDETLQLLHAKYVNCAKPEALMPREERAAEVVKAALTRDLSDSTRCLQLVWFAVVGTEKAETAAAFIRTLHEIIWRSGDRNGMELCTIARFWAATCRTPVYRRKGFEKRRDPVHLPSLAGWLYNLGKPAWYESSPAVAAEANCYWNDALRKEAQFVDFLAREATEKKTRRQMETDSFGGVHWHQYSTYDPAHRSNTAPLEVLQRNLHEADAKIKEGWERGFLGTEACRLFVAGPLARRFWTVLGTRNNFTVLLLGQKEAPQAGTNKKLASLAISRRALFQLNDGALQRHLQAPIFAELEAQRVHECRNAINCAFNEAWQTEWTALEDTKVWWQAAQKRELYCPETWKNTLAALSLHVALWDATEARNRRLQDAALATELEAQWKRRLVLTLRQAAAVASLALGEPLCVFLETCMERLARANEEPLLQAMKADSNFNIVRKGNTGKLLYSQELKTFVQYALAPLCTGPATSLRLLTWFLTDTSALPQVVRSYKDLPRKGHSWFRVYTHFPVSRSHGVRENYIFTEQEQEVLHQIAPFSLLPFSDFEHKRQRAMGLVVVCRRRLMNAARFARLFSARPALCGEALRRAVALTPCLEATPFWTQAELLTLLGSTDPGAVAEKLAELPPALALADFSRPLQTVEPESAESLLPQSIASSFLTTAAWQLDLLEAVHHIREFAEKKVSSAWRQMLIAESDLGALGRSVIESLGNHERQPLQRFLAGAIVYRIAIYQDLAAFLIDVEDYAAHFCAGSEKEQTTRAAKRLRAELLHYLHRTPQLKEAHAQQRRRQIEAFVHVQRNLYFDRPRPRGILHGWGHRIKGESEEIRCWIVEGESVRPWPRVRRALSGDVVAEAWHSAWCMTSGQKKKRQHDVGRADVELARDVLCDPYGRGIVDSEGKVKRARLDWYPDPAALAVPMPTVLEALDPRASTRPRLGAHEIQQPVLRRLVAPENVPDVAWMECLLRMDINGKRSHLALAQCPQMKRALEPLTHSIELWPLFASRFSLDDLVNDDALLAAFAREGSPVPVASKVAAHHALVTAEKQDCYASPAPPNGPLLSSLRSLLKARTRWPACALPSPVWDEKDLTGRAAKRRQVRRCDVDEEPLRYVVQLPRSQAQRLKRYQDCASEERWFEEERLQHHWTAARRLEAWREHQVRNCARYSLCRPCVHYYRRTWVSEFQHLDMTPWCDAGRLPDQLQLHSARLTQPAVFCSRSSGRRIQAGSLQHGPYTRSEHVRYIGDIGECVLFGQQQQALLRTLQQRGLVFIAINLDRKSMLKQFLAQACVLYLVGHWTYFPLFLGEGAISFPWLGSRWTRGLLYLQQLVRQRLRALLQAPEVQEALCKIRAVRTKHMGTPAAPDTARVLHKELPALRDLDASLPDIPTIALKIEEIQHNAILIHRARQGHGFSELYVPTRQELEDTLMDQPRSELHAVLVFPTEEHIRGKCSLPLEQNGFLVPKDLTKWASIEAIISNTWPDLGGVQDGNPRVETIRIEHKSAPMLHGEHIVVLPNWANYMRSLSERVGRGPREGHAPWDCRANLKCPPPPGHTLYAIFDRLARLQRVRQYEYTSSQDMVNLVAQLFPDTRSRWRGASREEAEEGEPLLPPDRAWRSPEFAPHCKKDIRSWIEHEDDGNYIEIRQLVDLCKVRPIRSASVCIKHALFLREKRLLAAKGSSRLTPGFSLDGALFLHGCRVPVGTATYSAQYVKTFSGGQRALSRECSAVREELQKELQEAEERTQTELSAARWPAETLCMPQLHGARAGTTRGVIFVAGRAIDFIVEALQVFTRFPCLALYPETVRKPCYELQIASVRLMQRQLARLYQDEPLLLVAVGREAHCLFQDLELLLLCAPQDAVALRFASGELEQLPADLVHWQLPVNTGIATLTQLKDDNSTKLLEEADPALKVHWVQLRKLLLQSLPPSCRKEKLKK